jgi:MYXO-CTERM domain-containing protein
VKKLASWSSEKLPLRSRKDLFSMKKFPLFGISALGSLILAFTACAASEELPGVSQVSQPIVGGTQTTDFAGVGIVFFSPARVCTGFLVSPKVVITAAHCFDGGKMPIAFYTGLGAPVATPAEVPSIPGLTKYEIASSARHPQAVTVPASSPTYPWQYDVAHVVLTKAASEAPLSYGVTVSAPQTCTNVGYGLNGAATGSGTGGLRRKGALTVAGAPNPQGHSLLAASSGPNFANVGDSGGPVICGGIVAGVSSWSSWNAANIITSNVYVGTDGSVKAWIDTLVAANGGLGTDAGTDAASDANVVDSATSSTSSGSSGNMGSTSSSSSSGVVAETPQPQDASDDGCNVSQTGAAPAAGNWFVMLLGLALHRLRRSHRRPT